MPYPLGSHPQFEVAAQRIVLVDRCPSISHFGRTAFDLSFAFAGCLNEGRPFDMIVLEASKW